MLETALFYGLITYSALLATLWSLGIWHAWSTPKEVWTRRGLWVLAIVVNPIAVMWYWYVWRRWAFWALFGPALAFLIFIRPTLDGLVQAFAARDVADRFVWFATFFLDRVLLVIPLPVLVPLVVFPFVHRLAALAHLGGNDDLTPSDRNDLSISFALPFVGFGAAMSYTFKWRRGWALAGVGWFVLAGAVLGTFIIRAPIS